MKPTSDDHHGVDIQALMGALPVSGLEPQLLASIEGLIAAPKEAGWREIIFFMEPPAGQRVPFVEPAKALDILLRHQGVAPEDAQVRSHGAVARMKQYVAEDRWVDFYDFSVPELPACLPVSDFVAWLRDEQHALSPLYVDMAHEDQEVLEPTRKRLLVSAEIIDFLEKAAEVTTITPVFTGPENWDKWSLKNHPLLPPPKAMIEFVPGAPWADLDEWDDWRVHGNPFMAWREAIRPVAQELEKALGEPVYYFADLNSDIDDDDVHRFLVLHWCCTWKPESAYVRYLVRVSGASNVDELKLALIDPTNYSQPFKMNSAFFGIDAWRCKFDFLQKGQNKTVTVVFFTPQARDVAQSLLAQKICTRAFIVAPKELATDEWVKRATRFCQDWTVRYEIASELNDPIEILSVTDELCVIADEKRPKSGFDLKLSELVEDLLWLALDFEVDAKYYTIEGTQLSNPQDCLRKCGVPERVAARKTRRAAFTRQLKEIRLENDFVSSGLWGANGKMLPYDLLNLPFPIVRRIAAWQRNYDDTMNPPYMGDDAWWDRHEQEALNIAVSLQDALGSDITVKLYQAEGWQPVEQIASLKRREP